MQFIIRLNIIFIIYYLDWDFWKVYYIQSFKPFHNIIILHD